MVDERRVIRLLRRVSADVDTLRRRARVDHSELLADDALMDAVKYVFVTAIEGCIRVAQHVAASEGLAAPATNADAFRLLAAHGVVDRELGERMAAAAGFRNLLIHRYVDIDDRQVIDNLGSLGELDAFVTAVTAWIGESRRS